MLPFHCNKGPLPYATLLKVKELYLRRHRIPALSYTDGLCVSHLLESREASEQHQCVAAARALRFVVAVAFRRGYYLAEAKCVLVPRQSLRYMGIICDARRAAFRVLRDKLAD